MPFVTVKNGEQKMKVYPGSMRYLMGQGFNPKVDEEIVVKAHKWNDDFAAATVTLPAQGKTCVYAMRTAARCGEADRAAARSDNPSVSPFVPP